MSEEIDLIEILKKIYKSRKFIFYSVMISAFFGIGFSLILPKKYSAKTVFIPQNQDSPASSLSGVASLVGINLGSNFVGGEIPSSMYPQIAESSRFKRILLSEKINLNNDFTLKNYLISEHNLSLVDDKKESEIYISELEEKCFKLIDKIISVNVKEKDGFVTITSLMKVPEYSAIIANKAKDILQNIIIENKIESARQNLLFSETQLSEKKVIFDEIQAKLSLFSDSNLNSVNSFVINERSKLESEFNIINAVVTELAKQVEQAKLQVTKDTPVFSTIIEAVIPIKRTSPKRTLMVLIFAFIGFILSIIYVLLSERVKEIVSSFK